MKTLKHGLLLIAGVLLPTWAAWASAENPAYYDIYLTGDRVCKQCTWQITSSQEVVLVNKKGVMGTYPVGDILGVDNHPYARRFLHHAAHGVGLPGRVLLPQAYENEKFLRY